ncbi:MAG TPA: hypothetical protein VFT74_07690 [Isosphaeraceae bacterium]|nr:hypothetical protein [Isosphaeraceae bacterium]
MSAQVSISQGFEPLAQLKIFWLMPHSGVTGDLAAQSSCFSPAPEGRPSIARVTTPGVETTCEAFFPQPRRGDRRAFTVLPSWLGTFSNIITPESGHEPIFFAFFPGFGMNFPSSIRELQ